MEYYLGIDLGTTSGKAVAFSDKGEVIARVSREYKMIHPQPAWSEQDPDELFAATVIIVDEIYKQLKPARPALVSFSVAMHSLLAVDKTGKPLTNCIIWADNRASEIADSLARSENGPLFYQLSGVPIHAMSPLCKLLWFKENDPDIFSTAYKFVGIKEYIFFKLFGVWAVDTAIASATGLLNLQGLQWDEDILRYIGIEASRLPEVSSVKKQFLYDPGSAVNKRLFQLESPTPFILGGSDGALANLGSGAASGDTLVVTIGTSSAVRIVTHHPVADLHMRTFCYHMKDDLYISGGASNNGGVVLQWMNETLLETDKPYPELFVEAEKIRPGCEGLVFLPYVLGERAPIWNANAKGVFFGLDIHHTKAHLIRAALEGVIFSVYSIGSVLMEQTNIKTIYATGGFVQSPLWLQILADVFNIEVIVSGSLESSALGAVMVGVESLGLPLEENENILSVHQPEQDNHKVYSENYEKFKRIYEALKGEFIQPAMIAKNQLSSTK